MNPAHNLIIFDIDGTLTDTNQVDTRCFLKAIEKLEANVDWNTFTHATDSCVLNETFQSLYGRNITDSEQKDFQNRFLSYLRVEYNNDPTSFAPKTGAQEAWLELLGLGWKLAVASGGWKSSGEFKLRTIGIDPAQFPCAFANDGYSREEITKTAIKRAKQCYKSPEFDSILYVGDGLWDAQASTHLNLPFIGIGSGQHKQNLLQLGALTVLPDLLTLPAACMRILDASTVIHLKA